MCWSNGHEGEMITGLDPVGPPGLRKDWFLFEVGSCCGVLSRGVAWS